MCWTDSFHPAGGKTCHTTISPSKFINTEMLSVFESFCLFVILIGLQGNPFDEKSIIDVQDDRSKENERKHVTSIGAHVFLKCVTAWTAYYFSSVQQMYGWVWLTQKGYCKLCNKHLHVQCEYQISNPFRIHELSWSTMLARTQNTLTSIKSANGKVIKHLFGRKMWSICLFTTM